MTNRKSEIENPRSFRMRLARWFEKNARDLPWRHTRDPYAILASEMMLQQTQVATVLGYYERWLRRFPDFATLAAAPEADVLHAWQGLGYYARARNLHRTARIIMGEHGGIFPRNIAGIRSLPGIGRYTAGAVASFAFGAAEPIVEANIARVLARLTDLEIPIDSSAGRHALWQTAADLLPEKNPARHNAALMDLGAMVCLPRRPDCGACPVRGSCRAREPHRLPVKRPRRATVSVTEHCAFIRSRGRVLLQQEAGARWRGLWRLPACDPSGEPLATLTYPITHHRVTLHVFKLDPAPRPLASQRWFSRKAIDAAPMPSPHRRALRRLLGAREIAS